MSAAALPVVETKRAATVPPFALPAIHLATAQLWLLVGAAGVVLLVPSLAAGAFLSPRVIAVTHAFTLGVVTTSVFGVLYQIVPVALAAPTGSIGLGHTTYAALQAGIVLMVVGSSTA